MLFKCTLRSGNVCFFGSGHEDLESQQAGSIQTCLSLSAKCKAFRLLIAHDRNLMSRNFVPDGNTYNADLERTAYLFNGSSHGVSPFVDLYLRAVIGILTSLSNEITMKPKYSLYISVAMCDTLAATRRHFGCMRKVAQFRQLPFLASVLPYDRS